MILPKYPIYIPSKGRSHIDLTTAFLRRDGVPFKLVVEPQEREIYASKFGEENILIIPERDRGVSYVRNWMKDHATAAGFERHWQLDDNISGIWRWWRGYRLYCESGPALRATEDFVDRYENVAIAGLNYVMFAIEATKPFVLNCHVYSCTLILNRLPNRWRGRFNEDTDMCLQVLSEGWCTILVNAFLAQKLGTMVVKGGQTDSVYQGDGRLKMARSLERLWPGVVETKRRFGRPQHVVKYAWRKFDNQLIRKSGVEIQDQPNEYGLKLQQVAPKIKSDMMRKLLEQNKALQGGKKGVKSKHDAKRRTPSGTHRSAARGIRGGSHVGKKGPEKTA